MGAPFAGVEDYEARYGAATDPARVAALLDDASAYLRAAYAADAGAEYEPGASPSFDEGARAVCCAMVARAASVPTGFEGTSQYTQTAGSYSASLTFANPTCDLYLTKSDRLRLGLGGTTIWSVRPMTSADRGDGAC